MSVDDCQDGGTTAAEGGCATQAEAAVGRSIRNGEVVDVQFRQKAGGQVRTPNSEFRICPGALRPGLEFVRSLSAATIRQILEQRLRGVFTSLEDFCARVRLGREELENLILCGAFDSLGVNRPTLLMKMERLLRSAVRPASGRRNGLFEDESDCAAPVAVPPQPPYPLDQRVLYELRILGFSHSGHPLDAWDGRLRRMASTPSYEMARHVGRTVTFVGWLVTMRRAVTRRHDYMEFLTLEDRHGIVEAVLFPDVYRRYGAQVTDAGCYKVVGQVDEEHGAVNIVAESVVAVALP